MKHSNKSIVSILLLIAIPLIIASFPGIPHQFYGNVSINGVSTNNGIVTAEIDNFMVGQTNIVNGRYGYNPIFFIEDLENDFNGKLINFYVNGIEATNYTFENGAVTNLNLEISGYTGFCGDSSINTEEECDDGNNLNGDGCSSSCKIEQPINQTNQTICGNNVLETGEQCDYGVDNGKRCNNNNQDCTYCSSACKLINLKEEDDSDDDNDNDDDNYKALSLTKYCDPNWDCSNWGECDNGFVKRTCTDTNKCGLEINKPLEAKICDLEKVQVLQEDKSVNWLIYLLFLSTLIIVVALIYLLRKI